MPTISPSPRTQQLISRILSRRQAAAALTAKQQTQVVLGTVPAGAHAHGGGSWCACTEREADLPGWLAVVGRDLHRQGWRLAGALPAGGRTCARRLPVPRGAGRVWLVLGAVVLGRLPGTAVPPSAKTVPDVLWVSVPLALPARQVRQLLVAACARGLQPGQLVPVPGPYSARVCLSLAGPVRAALERACRLVPGSTPQQWVRALAAGSNAAAGRAIV